MSYVLDIVGTVVAVGFFLSWKENHWHRMKKEIKKTNRRQ